MRRALGEITEPEPPSVQKVDARLRRLLDRRDDAVRCGSIDLYRSYMTRIDQLLDERLTATK